jgi:hypothetical protein
LCLPVRGVRVHFRHGIPGKGIIVDLCELIEWKRGGKASRDDDSVMSKQPIK